MAKIQSYILLESTLIIHNNKLMVNFLFIFSVAHEKEVKDMNNALRDLDRHKEGALREVAELKVQLKMVEETRDTIRRDLIDANRTIREGKDLKLCLFAVE